MDQIGSLHEHLLIQTPDPRAFPISSLVCSGLPAPAATTIAHGYATDDYVVIAGATPDAYNGTVQITVTSTTAFTYALGDFASSPASGSATAAYNSDAQGGRKVTWRDFAKVWGELI